jgi:hypothetical protein
MNKLIHYADKLRRLRTFGTEKTRPAIIEEAEGKAESRKAGNETPRTLGIGWFGVGWYFAERSTA